MAKMKKNTPIKIRTHSTMADNFQTIKKQSKFNIMKITKFFDKLTDLVWYRESLYRKHGRDNVQLIDYPLFLNEAGNYTFTIKTNNHANV